MSENQQSTEKENTSTELIVIDGLKFLSEIENAETISKKFKFLNSALNQEPFMLKNMNEQLKSKGLNTSKNTDYDYIPIEIVEEGLRQMFFRQIKFEIKRSYRELNSMICETRIHYKCPISSDWLFVDGIGAKALQQDSGFKVNDFNISMKSNALELGVGIAYSRSIKNAAKKLGKAFGANLNRDEEIDSLVVFNKDISLSKEDLYAKLLVLWQEKKSKVPSNLYDGIRNVVENKISKTYKRAINQLEKL